MIRKVDLVMWTKNSSKFLPIVLGRIEDVIPSEVVGRKIIIDDHSTDDTVEIAKALGWEVHDNPGGGIFDAFEAALHLVSSEFFISVEHDIILSKDWWKRISRYMEDDEVAVAQGVRVATHPVLRKLDEYIIERCDEKGKNRCLSIDNNLYRTKILRKFRINVHDHARACKFLQGKGFKWIIDRSVISEHIRPTIRYLIEHDYRMHKFMPQQDKRKNLVKSFILLIYSPIRAFYMAIKKRCPLILVVYPLDRIAIFLAHLR
ncbi:MAG: glycosyltransferase family 2 protein [Candidatus Bathyarchaeales archaeon]